MSRVNVELTAGAEDDLDRLIDHIAAHRSPAEALALLDALLERIETLERFPNRGAILPELATLGIDEFRHILMVPYRLVYRVSGRTVFVSLIADGRRDMQALLQRRLLGG